MDGDRRTLTVLSPAGPSGFQVRVSDVFLSTTKYLCRANHAESPACLTKSLAKELGSRGITVNAVAPGFIETDMTKVLPDELKAEMVKNIALGRPGQPEDVAKVVAFLSSDEAEYVTGQVVECAGGMSC